jgi:hypothetical protein
MKITKYILLLGILISSVCSETYAQHTFLKYLRYGNPESNCQGWSVQEAPNGNIIVQFRYRDSFSLGLDFGFFSLNKYGDSINTNVYHLDGDDFVEHIVLDGNNTVYGTGSRMSVGASFYDGILYKIDLLDSLNNQYHFYSNSDGNYSMRGILKKENSLYLAGSKNSATTSLNFNLHKIDLNGITLFDSSYIASQADFPYTSNFDNGGNILLSGGSFTGSTDKARILAMKVDTNGNEKWRTFVGIEGDIDFYCRSIGNGIIQSQNGAYYIAGGTDNWCDTNLETRGRTHSLLVKLDSNGNHLWTKKERFSNYWTQNYSEIYNTLDGNIVCIGSTTSIVDSSTLQRNYDILITKYDLNGDIIWSRIYGKIDFHEYVYNSTQTINGGFLLTGRYENIYNPFYDVQTYVMKLDDCGCLVPNCDPNCIASGVEESKKYSTINVFPNPSKNTLFIESNTSFLQYSIYNTIGQKVKSAKLNGNEINISELTSGIYTLSLDNLLQHIQVKFIKE